MSFQGRILALGWNAQPCTFLVSLVAPVCFPHLRHSCIFLCRPFNLAWNQNMTSDRGSTPPSKEGSIPTSSTPVNILGDSFSPTFNAASLPLPASDVTSPSHSYSLNSPGSIVPDQPAVRDAPSCNYHGCIDEDDIVIAYVFLGLRFTRVAYHNFH